MKRALLLRAGTHARCLTTSRSKAKDSAWGGIPWMKEHTSDSTWISPADAQGLSDAVRSAMRTLPHPVVVVTTCCEDSHTTNPLPIDPEQDNVQLLSPYYKDFCGAAISSLQTVTLGPPAIISFNLKMPSRTLSGLLHHKQFGVHLVKGSVPGKQIADAFVQQAHHEAFREATRKNNWVGLGLGPEQSRTDNPEIRIPLIRGAGVYAFMRCDVMPDKCIEVGDHMVVIAKIASLGVPQEGFDHPKSLAYQHGGYCGPSHRLKEYPYQPPKKTLEPIWQIEQNGHGIHNDALGYLKANPNIKDMPSLAIGSDPLGSIGEEEDGNLMSLSEEGYENLANQMEQRRLQREAREGPESESQEAESEETILEEIGSVGSSTEPNTGIPPEQEGR